ncbi:MAG: carboxypeptidase regulatory-like domain-containing protein [Candidatus Brockarchaeota archaeon]|nr:carboxypeptidase regulatory-like domain-containing protein [Candidatus Brockarchaeota archaeon]
MAIEGYVYYINSNIPVPNCTITADGYSVKNSSTTGYFYLDVPDGSYNVTFSSPTTKSVTISLTAPTKITMLLPPTASLSGPTGIEGYVFDASTGAPIANVTITYGWWGTAYTDSKGYYHIEMDPGTYDVTYGAPNYNGVRYTITVYSGLMQRIDAYLTPTTTPIPPPYAPIAPTPTPAPTPSPPLNARISGTVYYGGTPVQGAEVIASSGYGTWKTTTNSSGVYSMDVYATEGTIFIVTAKYNNQEISSSAILSPGVYKTLDLYIPAAPTPTPSPTPPPIPTKGYIKGVVLDYYSKAPVEGAKVTATEALSLSAVSSTTDSSGSFNIEVPASSSGTTYFVVVSKDKYNDYNALAKVMANQTFDLGTILLVLSEQQIGEYSAVVYGTVYLSKLPSVLETIDITKTPVQGANVKVTVYQVLPIVSYSATTDSNGNYSIKVSWSTGILPTGFKLEATYKDYSYSEDISLNPGDTLKKDIIFGVSLPSPPLGIPWQYWAAIGVAGALFVGYKIISKPETKITVVTGEKK